jgi:hypothetical protein
MHVRLLVFAAALSALAPVHSFARQRAQGDCSVGGRVVVTSGVPSTTKVQAAYPACTVTVYISGTTAPATIYSDNSGTAKSNPFAADATTGHWFWYAANGHYDVQLSGAGIGSPFVIGDILLVDPALFIPSVTPASSGNGISVTGTTAITIGQTAPLFADYHDFAAQSPAGTLSAGNNAITLAPVPLGVNWNDTNHWLWVAGTGTPEACLIVSTGPGTAVSGATSGTLILNCSGTHGAGYTVASATAGGKEAEEVAAVAGGGVVCYPTGTATLHATLVVDHWYVSIKGMGKRATYLQGDQNLTAVVQFGSDATANSYALYGVLQDLTVTRLLTISPNTPPVDSVGVLAYWYNYLTLSSVESKNSYYDVYAGGASISLGLKLIDCSLSESNHAYVRLHNVVEVKIDRTEMGMNGGETLVPTRGVVISGPYSDTVRISHSTIIPQIGTLPNVRAFKVISFLDYYDPTNLSFSPNGGLTVEDLNTENVGDIFYSEFTTPPASRISLNLIQVANSRLIASGRLFAFDPQSRIRNMMFSGNETYGGLPSTLSGSDYTTISGNHIGTWINFAGNGALAAGTYTSGLTATGSAGDLCILNASGGSGTGAVVWLPLTGTNAIAGGSPLPFLDPGYGYATAPTWTSATPSVCTGTVTASVTISTEGVNATVSDNSVTGTLLRFKGYQYAAVVTGNRLTYPTHAIPFTIDFEGATGNIVQNNNIAEVGEPVSCELTMTAGVVNDDIDPKGCTTLRLASSGAFSIGGFTQGYPGKVLYVYNSSSSAMTITQQSTGSTAGNRIWNSTAANGDLTINTSTGQSMATFLYDYTAADWVLAGTSVVPSGGSGGSNGTYNVKTSGAVGDGATDDTAAVQTALTNACTDGKGTVYFPPGTYKVSSISTPATCNGVEIRGSSEGASIVTTADTTQDTFIFTQTTGRGLKNGISDLSFTLPQYFTTPGSTVAKTTGAAVKLVNQDSFSARNVYIMGWPTGVETSNASTVRMDNVFAIRLPPLTGVGFSIDGNDVMMTNCGTSSADSTNQAFAGLWIKNTSGLWVMGGDYFASGYGLLSNPSSGLQLNWFVSDAAFDNNQNDGIAMIPSGTGAIRSAFFTGNWTAGNGANGVHIVTQGGSSDVTGVSFVNHRSLRNHAHGFSVGGSVSDFRIQSATIAGNNNPTSIAQGTLTNIVVNTNQGTATTVFPHLLITGDTVVVSGATVDSDLNGTYTITSFTPFTYTFTTSAVADATYTDAGLSIQAKVYDGFAVAGGGALSNWSVQNSYIGPYDGEADTQNYNVYVPVAGSDNYHFTGNTTSGGLTGNVFDGGTGTNKQIFGNLPISLPSPPEWRKYSLVSIANGVNTCANANGCWQVNGVYNSIRLAGLTQDVVLFQLPANGYVSDMRIKTAVACTGTTTAVTGLGTAGSHELFRVHTFDIQAAVAATNKSDTIAAAGSYTTAAENVVASLITTSGAEYIDTLAAACAVDYWLLWGVLQ